MQQIRQTENTFEVGRFHFKYSSNYTNGKGLNAPIKS